MAVSRTPGRTGSTNTFDPFGRVSRYDLMLAAVPVGFLLAFLAHLVTGLSLRTALAGGALVGLLVTADALFVHPPSGDPPHPDP